MEQLFINEIRCNFNLREPKGCKPTNVYLVASINNKQVKLATGVKVYPDQWNKVKQEAYISHRLTELDNINNNIVNDKITLLKSYFVEFKSYLCKHPDMISEGETLLKKYIYKDKIMKKEKKPINICSYLKQCIEKDNLSEGSKSTYLTSVKWLEEYIKDNGILITSFNEINTKFFNGFKDYLLNIDNAKSKDRHLSIGYINDTIKCIYQRLGAYAVRDELMDKVNHMNIVQPLMKDKSKDNGIALRDDEVLALWKYQPKDAKDELIRDIFVLNCVTGQRISDTNKVDDNVENIFDITTIKLVQKKTGAYINVSVIFELAKEILNKYKDGIPNINVVTFNKRIKDIAKEAGIKGNEIVSRQNKDGLTNEYIPRYELISSHTGRRTFITMLKLRGWDDAKITMYSGHSDDRMIKQYSKIKDTLAYEYFNKTKKEHPELLLRMVGDDEDVTSKIIHNVNERKEIEDKTINDDRSSISKFCDEFEKNIIRRHELEQENKKKNEEIKHLNNIITIEEQVNKSLSNQFNGLKQKVEFGLSNKEIQAMYDEEKDINDYLDLNNADVEREN